MINSAHAERETGAQRGVGGIGSLISPASVAIVGASGRRATAGNYVIKNLVACGYPGEIHVVHRDAAVIEGFDAARKVCELPPQIDVALVSVPAAGVTEVLAELVAMGCRAAIVPAVGLTPSDRRELEALASRGIAICGPNTMGVLNVAERIPMSISPGFLTDVRPGAVAVVAQSGGACLAVVRSTEHAGYSRIIPSGNEWTLTAADYLRWLADDDATESVGLVLESVNDAPGFVGAVAALRERGKRLVVLHVGQSEEGAAAAVAHTAALIGRPAAYRAFFADLDVPVVSDYDEMASVLDAFSYTGLSRARGGRVAALMVSGGLATLTADIAHAKHVEMAQLAPATREALVTLLPGAEPLNPLDTGGGASYTAERFAESVRLLASDPGVDSVMAVLDAQAAMPASELAYEEEDFVAVAAAARDIHDKPVIVASSSAATTHPRWQNELRGRTPVLRGIGNALVTLRALGMNQRASTRPATGQLTAAGEELRERVREAAHQTPGPLPADLCESLLQLYGIPTVRSVAGDTAAETLVRAEEIGFPLVAKIRVAGIAHRSNLGGVVTGIADRDSLRTTLAEIGERVAAVRPDIEIDGFELQEHLTTRLEATVGCVTDPVFGPVITTGLGGVLVELVGDGAVALAPLDEPAALRLIQSTRLATVAAGYRNLVQPSSLEPLATLISAFSRMMRDYADVISEADLNPVLLDEGTGAAHVVDSLLVAAS